EMVRVELLDELNGFGGRIDEIGFRGGQRFETDRDSPFFRAHDGLAKRRGRPRPGVPGCDAVQNVALLGRAEDHDLSPEIRAEVHQLAQVSGRLLTDGRARMGQLQAFGLYASPRTAGDGPAGWG